MRIVKKKAMRKMKVCTTLLKMWEEEEKWCVLYMLTLLDLACLFSSQIYIWLVFDGWFSQLNAIQSTQNKVTVLYHPISCSSASRI